MFNSINAGGKRKVRQLNLPALGVCPRCHPDARVIRWQVTNHPTGPMTFYTWDEAMAYANTKVYIMNTMNAAEPYQEQMGA